MAKATVPIVAIGASAGGLEALQKLVQAIPAGSGLCYVIVQHLSADHPSIMDQLLGAHSAIEVKKIENGARAEADCVYVIPAGPSLTISDGHFCLHDDRNKPGLRTPIDRFFISVAEEVGRDAFCVVLSGTGSDGTIGLKAVKAAGGIAIVQESESARFPGMPDSARATGLVDFTMKAENIPARLIDIVQNRGRLHNEGQVEQLADDIADNLPEISALLNDSEGHDFSDYKQGTLIRRIERRMTLLRQRTIAGFMELLRQDPQERERLLQDFLIGVTHFFRDPDAFAELREQALDKLAAENNDKLRIWVPGCSTGEEAYSIAIAMLEALESAGCHASLQVFGTDIDAAALMQARQGYFPESSFGTMPEAYAKRYFVAEEGGRRASPLLREACIFAPHNLLQDPPFSKLDLISCRNLLIYLNADAQKQVVPRFHYALKPSRYMFLGPSETLGSQDDLFSVISKKHRLFKRNDTAAHRYSALSFSRERQQKPLPETKRSFPQTLSIQQLDAPTIEAKADALFLRTFAAPYAVVNASNEVTYLSEQMVRFVKPSRGVPSAALDAFLTRDLRYPVRTAIAEVRSTGEVAETRNVIIEDSDHRQLFDVSAAPMDEDGFILVVLRPVRQPEQSDLAAASEGQTYPGREVVEDQLAATRQQLELTLREHDNSSQELRSTNEELLSMNEELQSANEELETSREELQSINEELETMNAELNENNEQLRRANSDIKNLFESTDIATLFLDSQLCVRGFTPKTAELFGIRERDTGRPVSDLAQRFAYDGLLRDVERVGKSLEPIEREVTISETNESFILRIRPYRTVDDRIDGFILSFFNVTQLKLNEATLERNAKEMARQFAELETLYDTTPVGLCLLDKDLRYLRINEELAAMNGFAPEEHIGKTQAELIPEIDAMIAETQRKVFDTGEAILGIEVRGTTSRDPENPRDWIVDYYPVRNDDEVFAVGACVTEVTSQKETQRELARNLARVEESEAQLTRIFDAAPAFIGLHQGPEHIYKYANPELHRTLAEREIIGKPIAEAVPEIVGAGIIERFDEVYRTAKPMLDWDFLADIDRGNGLEPGHYRQVLQPWYDEDGNVAGVMSFAYDITALKYAEDRKNLMMSELQHRVKNTLATILAIVRFTARSSPDVPTMQQTLTDRLQAISRTHNLLTDGEWVKLSFRDIIASELEPYEVERPGQIILEGSDVALDPEDALSLSMAVHELITNSVKHGALSDPKGSLKIVLCHGTDGDLASLTWSEVSERIKEPKDDASGFGRFLLEKGVAAQVGGTAELKFEKGNLTYNLSFGGSRE